MSPDHAGTRRSRAHPGTRLSVPMPVGCGWPWKNRVECPAKSREARACLHQDGVSLVLRVVMRTKVSGVSPKQPRFHGETTANPGAPTQLHGKQPARRRQQSLENPVTSCQGIAGDDLKKRHVVSTSPPFNDRPDSRLRGNDRIAEQIREKFRQMAKGSKDCSWSLQSLLGWRTGND